MAAPVIALIGRLMPSPVTLTGSLVPTPSGELAVRVSSPRTLTAKIEPTAKSEA
jgi:hypothetical protein